MESLTNAAMLTPPARPDAGHPDVSQLIQSNIYSLILIKKGTGIFMSYYFIREARSEDADVLVDFNIKMARETEQKTLDPKVIQKGIMKLFKEPDLGFYTVVEVDGEIAGALMITAEWSDWRNGLFWWIQSVYILPEFRRQGIFASLYKHIRNRARQDPAICGLRLYVEKENKRAQRTYLKVGMQETDYRVYEEEF